MVIVGGGQDLPYNETEICTEKRGWRNAVKAVNSRLEPPQFRQLGSSGGLSSAENARGRDLARRGHTAVTSRISTCLRWFRVLVRG